MKPVLVLSCSLNPASRSHRLALAANQALQEQEICAELIDLREWDLPICDGDAAYSHPAVSRLQGRIAGASAILLAAPVYNFDLNAAAKNVVELTGSAWKEKPVGMLCAAGGRASYMAPMGLANSLMLDFRSWILPRFVYATKSDFDADGRPSREIQGRINELARETVDLARGLAIVKERR